MAMTFIENILSNHSENDIVKPGEIVDVEIDVRAARDFGGPNVVKNLIENNLKIDDPFKYVDISGVKKPLDDILDGIMNGFFDVDRDRLESIE